MSNSGYLLTLLLLGNEIKYQLSVLNGNFSGSLGAAAFGFLYIARTSSSSRSFGSSETIETLELLNKVFESFYDKWSDLE